MHGHAPHPPGLSHPYDPLSCVWDAQHAQQHAQQHEQMAVQAMRAAQHQAAGCAAAAPSARSGAGGLIAGTAEQLLLLAP